jgi:hypothetical protein
VNKFRSGDNSDIPTFCRGLNPILPLLLGFFSTFLLYSAPSTYLRPVLYKL